MTDSRFPFTHSPKGWFCVALSSELGEGEVKPVKAFERDLVLHVHLVLLEHGLHGHQGRAGRLSAGGLSHRRGAAGTR